MTKQVLIVDDTPIILTLLNVILSEEYSIVAKKNGIEAFNWLDESNFPDLIISDLNMPYFDGISFIRNLKISGFYQNTPVIVLSGAEDMETQVKNMDFKVDGYISKPFNPLTLKSIIDNVLNRQSNIHKLQN